MPESRSARRARIASYVPLRITARLRCGIVSDGLLPFDAILYWAQHRDVLPDPRVATLPRARTVQDEDAERTAGTLPLRRIDGDTPQWYHAASCAVWPASVADGLDHWAKRLDSGYVELLEQRAIKARVPISGGVYRAYHMPLAYRHALAVTWYAVGEPERIRELLRLVTHLGKKPSMGWGAVIDWTVEPCADDWSVTGPEGQIMRPIPDAAGATIYGIRAPYWLPRHQVPCRLPAA